MKIGVKIRNVQFMFRSLLEIVHHMFHNAYVKPISWGLVHDGYADQPVGSFSTRILCPFNPLLGLRAHRDLGETRRGQRRPAQCGAAGTSRTAPPKHWIGAPPERIRRKDARTARRYAIRSA